MNYDTPACHLLLQLFFIMLDGVFFIEPYTGTGLVSKHCDILVMFCGVHNGTHLAVAAEHTILTDGPVVVASSVPSRRCRGFQLFR